MHQEDYFNIPHIHYVKVGDEIFPFSPTYFEFISWSHVK